MRNPDATTIGSTIAAIVISGIITAQCAESTDGEIGALDAKVDTVAGRVETLEDMIAGSQVGTVMAAPQSDGTIDLWWTTPSGAMAPTHYRVLWTRPETAGEWREDGGTFYRFEPGAEFGQDNPFTIGEPPSTLASGGTYEIKVRAVTCVNGRWVRGEWSEPVEVITKGLGNTHKVRLGTMGTGKCPP
ncbi:fibronectin type III domain-containing protein [Candidatus Palauibacter sp.]|uniref:fibronectin type III domain-containing protein n=1 Tax=Candidatus Palauibacter sp. TaxID=3101350 RepID=UPI003B5906C7